MEQQLTTEQIAKIIQLSFDSVALVEELNALSTLTDEEQDTKARNVEHLEIMMSKEWFASALTAEQEEQINAIING